MSRRLCALLVALPCVAWGLLVAHDLAYRLVAGSVADHAHLLEETGHGYLAHALPAVSGLSGIAAAAFLVLVQLARRARVEGVGVGRWIAAAPLVGFAVQEHAERWVHDGSVPWSTAAEPTFLAGLALLVPFGLAARAAARAMLRAAVVVGVALRGEPRLPLAALPRPGRAPALVPLPRPPVLAVSLAGRGPPAR
jgi:hypothetical protein